jgi:hypothetical protein
MSDSNSGICRLAVDWTDMPVVERVVERVGARVGARVWWQVHARVEVRVWRPVCWQVRNSVHHAIKSSREPQ